MDYQEELKEFENYCPKCGGINPNCDRAIESFYRVLKDNPDDAHFKQGVDLCLQYCGNKQCGSALSNYLKITNYNIKE